MKFAKILKNILLAITILSVISFSESRRSSSKTRDEGDGVAKDTNYQSTLKISHENSVTSTQIEIDMDSFSQMNYGIEFTVKKGVITNPAFFLVSPNTYLLNFRHVAAINCLNQGLFSQNSMHFMAQVKNKSFEIIFEFPNGWAFADGDTVLSMCRKFNRRYNDHQTKTQKLSSEIIQLFSKIQMVRQRRELNIDTKTKLKKYGDKLELSLIQTNSTIQDLNKKNTAEDNKIRTIGDLQAKEQDKLNSINGKKTQQTIKRNLDQKRIDTWESDFNVPSPTNQNEIYQKQVEFSNSLNNLIDIHSDYDFYKKDLQNFSDSITPNVSKHAGKNSIFNEYADKLMKSLDSFNI